MTPKSQQLKKTNNFFEKNITKLASLLKDDHGESIQFNESQVAMVQGLEDNRFWVHIAARRTGKSWGAAIIALAKLLEKNKNVAVVAPNFNLSSIIWDIVDNFIRQLDLTDEIEIFNRKERIIKFKWGSIFRLLSANNRDSLVGRGYHLVVVDEAAVIDDEEYFTRDIRPALSTFSDSRCLFISTPRGTNNYLHDYFKRGLPENAEKFPDWGCGIYTYEVNKRLSAKDIEEAKRSMPRALFRQEYLCDWASVENRIYELEDDNLIDTTEIRQRKLLYIAGLDVGYRDSTAFVVIGTDGDRFIVLDEYTTNESTTSVIAERIKELEAQYNWDNLYIDSAAQQAKADLAYDYDIFCENANKNVNDGIMNLQVLCEQKKLLFCNNKSLDCFEAMQNYCWNVSTEKPKPKHDKNSHFADAVRYAIYSFQKNQVDIYHSSY